MNFKTTYILFAVFCALLLAFGFALWFNPATDVTDYVLPSIYSKAHPLKQEDVDSVEIDRTRPKAEKLVFVKDAETGKWKITQPHDYRGDIPAITALIRQVANAVREKEVGTLSDLKKAGMEPPVATITLKKGDREVWLKIGEEIPSGASAVVYVTSTDYPKEALAVKKSSIDDAYKPLADFRSRELLAPSSFDIQSVTLAEAKKPTIELKKAGDNEERWVYVQPPYGRAENEGAGGPPDPAKAPATVRDLLQDVSDLRVANTTDFVDDEPNDHLAKYHLDDKSNPLKVGVERTDEINTTLADGDKKKERKTSTHVLLIGVAKKADDKSDQYYAMLEDEKHVVKVSGKNVEPLRKLLDNAGALRDRNLVDTAGFRKPDAIDVKNSYGTLEFRKESEQAKWKLYRGDTPSNVEEPAITLLVTQLTQKNVIERFDDPKQKATLGLDKPDVVVKLWLDGMAKDEPETDKKDDKEKDKPKEKKDAKPKLKDPNKPSVTLRFGNKEKGSVAVERQFADESSGTIVMVPERLLDTVRQGPLAYLERELPRFAQDFDAAKDVTNLVIQRGEAVTEVKRDKTDAPWKIVKPVGQAGKAADAAEVDRILRELNTLKPTKLVEEKADPVKLDNEYGLKVPAVKVVITQTKDGKPRTIEYAFGKDAGQGTVFAKSSQSDMVVTVGTSVLTDLGRELQNLTVFKFDVDKVSELKLAGWQELFGGATELQLKRKDKAWVAEKAPAKIDPDAEKVRKFLTDLSGLRAQRFVSHGAAPTAAEGLEVDKGALKVEVVVEGEKEPFVVTVGKPDGSNGLFATSNRLPGDVFDVRKEIFEGPKSKPAYFSK